MVCAEECTTKHPELGRAAISGMVRYYTERHSDIFNPETLHGISVEVNGVPVKLDDVTA